MKIRLSVSKDYKKTLVEKRIGKNGSLIQVAVSTWLLINLCFLRALLAILYLRTQEPGYPSSYWQGYSWDQNFRKRKTSQIDVSDLGYQFLNVSTFDKSGLNTLFHMKIVDDKRNCGTCNGYNNGKSLPIRYPSVSTPNRSSISNCRILHRCLSAFIQAQYREYPNLKLFVGLT